jgi:uncharacterized membrane protein YeaQ/YmgE (transglycosylase-associated protein family)
MDHIVSLILGAVAGFLAVLVMYRTIPSNAWQWGGALLIGLIGGWLGGLVTGAIGLKAINWLGAIAVAFASAVIVLAILRRALPGK